MFQVGSIHDGTIGEWFQGITVKTDANGIVTSDTTAEYTFTSFNELKYFTSQVRLGSTGNNSYFSFSGCNNLRYMILPETITAVYMYTNHPANGNNNQVFYLMEQSFSVLSIRDNTYGFINTSKTSNRYILSAYKDKYRGQQVLETIITPERLSAFSQFRTYYQYCAPQITYTDEIILTMTVERDSDIYYTLDGSTPTTNSTKYTQPFAWNGQGVIKAMAIDTTNIVGDIAYAQDFYATSVSDPEFTLDTTNKTVTLNCNTSGATIYYTLDGTCPNYESPIYSDPIETQEDIIKVRCFAHKEGMNDSNVVGKICVLNDSLWGTGDTSTFAIQTIDSTKPNYNPAVAIILFNKDTYSDFCYGGGGYYLTKTDAASITTLPDFQSITTVNDSLSIVSSSYESYTFSSFNELKYFTSFTNLNITFKNCTSLRSIYLENITTITQKEVFYGCSALESVKFRSITQSGGTWSFFSSFFANCTSLTNIDLGTYNASSTIRQLGNYTFSNCSSLTSLIIPENFTALNGYNIPGCTNLNYLELPSTITSIGVRCFATGPTTVGYYSPSTIIIKATTPPSLSDTLNLVFGNMETTTIYVGSGIDYNTDNDILALYRSAWTGIPSRITLDTHYNYITPKLTYISGNVTVTVKKDSDIYYTLDGTTPTINSTKYTQPFAWNGTGCIKSMAIDTKGNIQYAKDFYATTVDNPVISFNGSEITITTSTTGASIYYTCDGSYPTSSSTLYTGPTTLTLTTIPETVTVRCIATKTGYNDSEVVTATESIIPYNTFAVQTLDSTKPNYNPAVAIILQSLDKGTTLDEAPISGQEGRWFITKTDAATFRSGLSYDSRVFNSKSTVTDSNGIVTSDTTQTYDFTTFHEFQYFTEFTYIGGGNNLEMFCGCSNLKQLTVPDNIKKLRNYGHPSHNNAIVYLLMQSAPTELSIGSNSINFIKTNETTDRFILCPYKDSYRDQVVYEDFLEHYPEIPTNIFKTWKQYACPQITYDGTNVTMTVERTSDIYYTLDGSTPTENSTQYTTAFAWNGQGVIKAVAIDSTTHHTHKYAYSDNFYATSVSDPEFTLDTTNKTVTISCSTPGATIYYTTDGTCPTLESNTYSEPIETQEDIIKVRCFAHKEGMNDSNVVGKICVLNDSLWGTDGDTSSFAIQTIDSTKPNYNPAVAIILNNNIYSNKSHNGGGYYLTKTDALNVTFGYNWFYSKTTLTDTEGIITNNTESTYDFEEFNELKYFNSIPPLVGNDGVFYNCSKLKYVTLPASVTSIPTNSRGGFRNCTSLISINLDNVTSLGPEAFQGCENLEISSFPIGVTYLGSNTFSNCGKITFTNLGNVTQIGGINYMGCFMNCTNLANTLTEIPSTVTVIGSGAFRNIQFPYLHILPTTPPTGVDNFTFNQTTKLYVGNGVSQADDNSILATYQSASGWSGYSSKLDTWYNYLHPNS